MGFVKSSTRLTRTVTYQQHPTTADIQADAVRTWRLEDEELPVKKVVFLYTSYGSGTPSWQLEAVSITVFQGHGVSGTPITVELEAGDDTMIPGWLGWLAVQAA